MRVDVLLLQAVGSGCGAAVCPVCGKAFQGRNRRQNLAHHLLTHTGTRPFPCPHCSYRATQKAHLKRHLERRHGQVGERLRCSPHRGTLIGGMDLEGTFPPHPSTLVVGMGMDGVSSEDPNQSFTSSH